MFPGNIDFSKLSVQEFTLYILVSLYHVKPEEIQSRVRTEFFVVKDGVVVELAYSYDGEIRLPPQSEKGDLYRKVR